MAEVEARSLVQQAIKKRDGFSFFSGNAKYEEAAEIFVNAANKFKAAKNYAEAGKCFVEAGSCMLKVGSKFDAAQHFLSGAQAYKKVEPPDLTQAVYLLTKAVDLNIDQGRFHIAAKHQKEIAEIYEGEGDLKNAISAYNKAAEWFEGEDSKSSATACKLKVALFSAQLEDYLTAYTIYEQVASASLDNNLTRWSVKEYFFKAGLCYLCNDDLVGAQQALQRFKSMDATFEGTRECQFLTNIIGDYEANDVESFTNHVVEYDNFSKLDNWKTTTLLKIKRHLRDEPSLT